MIYLDNAATTRVSQKAAEAAQYAMLEYFGNPSSLHGLGIQAERLVEDAREQVAHVISSNKEEIFFTSGGTEGNNIAIFGAANAKRRRGQHIITTAMEHSSVLEPMRELENRGFEVTYLKPEQVTPEGVLAELREDTVLISIMSVNNEVGCVYPVSQIARAVRRVSYDVIIHTDAVQAFLKIPLSAREGLIDLLTISGHKVHAPKGVGALYIRKGVRIKPRCFGGGQERAMRPGTESVPLIVAFGEAIQEGYTHFNENTSRMQEIIAHLEDELSKISVVQVIKPHEAPHILSIAIQAFPSEVSMRMLESEDIYVSSGSACSKGRRSYVLETYRVPPSIIDGALRLSISDETKMADVDKLVKTIQKLFIKP